SWSTSVTLAPGQRLRLEDVVLQVDLPAPPRGDEADEDEPPGAAPVDASGGDATAEVPTPGAAPSRQPA
ncbi:MAG: hypothetical protein AAGH15_20800, partial [Myxococcota bacterium]